MIKDEAAKSAGIIRKSFGLKKDILPQLKATYDSPLIDRIKTQNFRLEAGRLTICLAQEFGFCYGVDRAIDYAYETKAKFPDRRIFLTNEIIHNPRVNAKLQELGIQFLAQDPADGVTINDLTPQDVVLIPAFGNPMIELEHLQKRGCVLVDTTCGSVMSVWKRVESYSRDGFTAVIHGKYDHEETLATSSRAKKYVIVRDKEQAQKVCDFIRGKFGREEFMREFERALSPGFDPAADLQHIGCANQTTMLSSESLEIANMLQQSMTEVCGVEETCRRFRHFDTICSATQDRQDAVLRLVREDVDLMVVVGGYNSSNTGHLVEISLGFCPAYHIKDAECILSADLLQHKKVMSKDIIETRNWLPEGPVKLGITAGASTPNKVIEEVMERILQVANVSPEGA
ncbi:MAG TPA: 4-hydroxy-3-methylbut-2-enyl diphosphate reductase [Verrucomicrobiae bacterium]|jgi:4-hydroxy-3-methylbut-2-enyl diphosphate reductase|nr:4-hydroxy-3-methylbut-2-enyl diphosphate reductase [Verrucomicrobiae bacterium]